MASIADVFPTMVEKCGDDECWLWLGRKKRGYGVLTLRLKAHRYSYEVAHGRIPDGLGVLHSCDNPACVNPAHLRLGTQRDNLADSIARGRLPRGEDRGNAKLSTQKVQAIREAYRSGTAPNDLAQLYGVSRRLIDMVVRRELWTHVP